MRKTTRVQAEFVKYCIIGIGICLSLGFLMQAGNHHQATIFSKNDIEQSSNNQPLFIDGNRGNASIAALIAKVGGTGNGSISNPYIIQNLKISGANASSGSGLCVANTRAYIILQNCAVQQANGSNQEGINVSNCTHVTLINCSAVDYNVGIFIAASINTNVTRNTVSNNTLIGLFLASSNKSSIVANHVVNSNTTNIGLDNANGNNISENILTKSYVGMELSVFGKNCSDNRIYENNVTGSTLAGILMLHGHTNTIWLNNFINNTNQAMLNPVLARDGTNNNWNSTSLGNYWSDYTAQYPSATSSNGVTWNIPYQVWTTSLDNKKARDYFPLINPVIPNHHAPALTGGSVMPGNGNQATLFTFHVMYTDLDNNYPTMMVLKINSAIYDLTKQVPTDNNYMDGCLYGISIYVQPGLWNYQFNCSDTLYSNWTIMQQLNVTQFNSRTPALTNGNVTPAHGYAGITTFSFSVTYTDADNNEPAQINVTVTSSHSITKVYPLLKKDGADTNYEVGCAFTTSIILATADNYTFYFSAWDGTFKNNTSTYAGLRVDAGYSIANNNMRIMWTGWYLSSGSRTNISGQEVYTSLGGGLYRVTSGFGQNREINGSSRAITTAQANAPLIVGSHEPMRIFTDVQNGSQVQVGILYWELGDQTFTVVGQAELVVKFANGSSVMFKCWLMKSPQGRTAYYDQFSGLFINCTMVSRYLESEFDYSMQISGVLNVQLAPNKYALTLTVSVNSVTPFFGNQETLFKFNVTYTDLDNYGPVSINVTINGNIYAMYKQYPADITYNDGCVYMYQTYLQPGNYSYTFSTSDGQHLASQGPITGLIVSGMNSYAPVLSGGTVMPANGYNNTTTFTFTVNYSDADNNAPKFINVTIDATTYNMTKQVTSDNNYMAGCIYQCTTTIASPGTVSFTFKAFDGKFPAINGPFGGLVVYKYYPIATNGMGYNYTEVQDFQAPRAYRDRFIDVAGGNIFVKSTWANRTIAADSRIIIGNNKSAFVNGSHEPMLIFTNIGLGSVVPVAVLYDGDQQFTVTGAAVLHAMNRPFDCWELQSPEGSIAYYEKYSGLLINGTFKYQIYGFHLTYSIQVTGTNETLSPNAHDPMLINAKVFPATGHQNSTFNLSVVYKDLDGNSSAYVNLVFNGTTFPMLGNGSTSYTTGVMYNATVMYYQPGNYSYYFTCSDKEFTNTTKTYYLDITRSNTYSPVLSSPKLTPPASPSSPAPYTFQVTYTDADNNMPTDVHVTINGTTHVLTKVNATDVNYMDGCIYQATIMLLPGQWDYNFTCNDSFYVMTLGTFSFTVNVFTPTLTSPSVSPASGATGPVNVTFTVTYSDGDDNPPLNVNLTINGVEYLMHKQDLSASNYTAGCVYTITILLDPGSYTYSFHCSDFLFAAATNQNTIDVAQPFPMMTVLIVVVIIAAGVVIIAIGVTASKKKTKKAKVTPKQKASGKTRTKEAKKLPDAQATVNVPSPSSYTAVQAQAPMASPAPVVAPALGRFQCGSCGKEFKLAISDPSQRVNCPDCGTALFRIIVCTRCGKLMSITQDMFPQYVGKSIQCPDCKNVFKV